MSRSFSKIHWKILPRPLCCEKIIEYPIVYLASTTFEGEEEKPEWRMNIETPSPGWPTDKEIFLSTQSISVIKCPFCAIMLPEIELKTSKIPKKIRIITDSGYYCDTCEERLQSCECYPSETKYQIK